MHKIFLISLKLYRENTDWYYIVTSFGTLIDHAKEKSRKVTVASITPRLTSGQVQEKIDAVNAGLLTLCAEKDATFVANMPHSG